jgi:hypothetical protein
MSLVNSYTNWSPLQEVWLGDVYPTSWYDHLPSEVRDCFQEITERTKEDLDLIQKKIESFGVQVCRPHYDSIDNFVNPFSEQLEKPEICPRDYYVTIGTNLYAHKKAKSSPWHKHVQRYKQSGAQVKPTLMVGKNNDYLSLNGANTVRAGHDIYFDFVYSCQNKSHQSLIELYQEQLAQEFEDYRVHILFNGGHVDACFSLLKPGVILGNRYFDDYQRTFPDWELIETDSPDFYEHARQPQGPGHNGTWWLPGMQYSCAFNEHVIKHAQTWVGNYTETFFEVNCLVIDEKNVIIPGENIKVFEKLEKLGITAHAVPFRTRTFWDGGLHCITLDIRRSGEKLDYFPNRENTKLIVYD